jgi:nucleolar protein TMA23
MSGVGKDRDEAVPFWDKYVESDHAKRLIEWLTKVIVSSIFASAAQSIASGTSTPLGSGASTPIATQSGGPSSMSVMARSKKEFARLKLYASFVRGEVIEFKPSDPQSSVSAGGLGSGGASPKGSATPMHQHKIMKSQLWNVQPAPSASTSTSPSPIPASTTISSKINRKAEKALEKAAKRARRAAKETRRAEKEAKRAEKERRRAEKKEAVGTNGIEEGSDGVKEKKRKRSAAGEDVVGTKEVKKKRRKDKIEALEGDEQQTGDAL